MRISAKGQITIPQSIRDQFGLLPNTDVVLEVNNAGEIVLRKNSKDIMRGKTLIQLMTNKASVKLTTDEIMQLTRS